MRETCAPIPGETPQLPKKMTVLVSQLRRGVAELLQAVRRNLAPRSANDLRRIGGKWEKRDLVAGKWMGHGQYSKNIGTLFIGFYTKGKL